jgi:hypothetical protein
MCASQLSIKRKETQQQIAIGTRMRKGNAEPKDRRHGMSGKAENRASLTSYIVMKCECPRVLRFTGVAMHVYGASKFTQRRRGEIR